MNTRQKLTLGIAAIFMVTLTIVGVTYAYFFTRVTATEEDATDITASTATISSINYWEEDEEPVVLGPDALPGSDPVYKVFGAENPNAVNGSFRIALTNTPGATEFLHSSTDAALTAYNADCYDENVDTDEVDDSACRITVAEGQTNNSYYDNIVFSLYEYDNTKTNNLGTEILGKTKVKYVATVNNEQFVADESGNPMVFTVDAKADGATENPIKKYVLVVSYENKTEENKNNQNLEFGADLTIRVTIK